MELMMKYFLFLDDERMPPGNPRNYTRGPAAYLPIPWMIARRYVDFKWYITAYGLPTFVSFDHDLGEGQRTGQDCAWLLVNYCLDQKLIPKFSFHVHSMNPVGKENIERLLRNFKNQFKDETNVSEKLLG